MVARAKIPPLRFQGPVYEQIMRPFSEGRFDELENEYLIEGPTGTGKSVAIAALVYYALRTYPGCNLVVMRRFKADLAGSFMQMWETEICDWSDPWDRWMLTNGTGGGVPSHRSREVYAYPNGSRLWCRGMDQWPRMKSMAFDIVWPMEATEFEERDIEGVTTRIRARKGFDFPHRMMLMDVNPEYPQHWANQRAEAGISTRIKTTLKDNPGYYDRTARDWTPNGREYLDRLPLQIRDESRRRRYIEGIWAAATGQILDWDEDINLFDGRVVSRPGQPWMIEMDRTHPVLGDRVELKRLAASFDWGSAHAGTLQVWGVCGKGRQYLVEEVYHSGKPVQWWASWAVKFWKKYDLQFIACDSPKVGGSLDVFRERLSQEGGARANIAIPCIKRSGNRQESNMEVLQDLFCEQADGHPGVYMRRNALAHEPDPDLGIKRLAEEVPAYVYADYDPSRRAGRPEDRPDKKCVDDGLDACTYFRVELAGGRKMHEKLAPDTRPKTHEDRVAEAYWRDEDA